MARKPAWKIAALQEARDLWIDLHDEGYVLETLTDYHWRYKDVNIWPSSKKFQKIGGSVDRYEDLTELVKSITKYGKN